MEKVRPENTCFPFFVGIDVGGTTIKMGILDDQGKTVGYSSIPTLGDNSPREAISRIGQALRTLASDHAISSEKIESAGLGTPGTMDIPRGMILEPANLRGWRHFPIRDELSRELGLPVTYANDANAAAYGEYWVGSARQHNSLILLTLGTGVGGGIIVDGKSLDGETGHGGECGHVTIDTSENARLCSCGQRGHLEAYASATALVNRCVESLDAGEKSELGERHSRGEPLDGLMIAEAAEADDPLAKRLVMETADYLAVGIAIFVNIVDASTVILGGAMNFGGAKTTLGRQFLERVRSGVRARALPVVGENVRIQFASLGGAAGYIGAAGLAREAYRLETERTKS
ncbi:MAG: ROK family protein [Planctomycetota bacterium]|nr:ROK family protein [Planctomycetota bacterium]